jgi:hypothetical protein
MNQLTDRVDPLANPNVIRILLSETQSQELTASGERAFVSVSRCSYPGNPTRWQILVSPVDIDVLNQANRVLSGESRSVRIRKIRA